MGGAVSAGQDNDELVDNLCYEDYIRTPEVEKVFRQVDRADFMVFTDDQDCMEAYEDHAWRHGTLHLSAPCIYTRAVEALQFKRGVSFLNVGSGTGYLSTMAGLLIGAYGINHGIEIYPENVEFAQEKQEEFLERFAWYDPLEFCEPLFVVGNGLLLSPGNLLYDRIYCGAACPPEHVQLMKNMLTVGGILVMPHENQLEGIQRVSQTEWKGEVVLPSVSFAPLILPSQESVEDLAALEIAVQPLPLKQCCRLSILKQLGREKYGRISELPLPRHLKDYVSYFREWGPPSTPVRTLCPIDHSKQNLGEDRKPTGAEGGTEAGAGLGPGQDNRDSSRRKRGGARGRGAGGGSGGPGSSRPNLPYAQSMNINGRKMLICNINGMYFQIPIGSDDNASDSDDVAEEEDLMDDSSISEKEDEDHLSVDNHYPSDEYLSDQEAASIDSASDMVSLEDSSGAAAGAALAISDSEAGTLFEAGNGGLSDSNDGDDVGG